MERLTFDGRFCDIAKCSLVPGGSFCESGSCSQRKTWERLKAYEDTGLSPEDIDALRAREQGLVELLARVSCGCAVTYDRLRELAEADRDGRLVVLPGGNNDAVLAAAFLGEKPAVMHGGGDTDDLIALTHVLVSYAAETLGACYIDFCWALGEMPPTKDFKPAKEAEAAVEGKEVAEDG